MTTVGPGMRVRCINDAWTPGPLSGNGPLPPLGSKWTVLRVCKKSELLDCGVCLPCDYVSFCEIGPKYIYALHFFAPIDEGLEALRELAREAKNPDELARKRELV